MNIIRSLLLGLIGLEVLTGCVGVSMHSMYPVCVEVTHAPSDSPVGGLPLKIIYDYDSYGWFYLFNEPADVVEVTNENGIAIMHLADFRYRILLKIENRNYSLSEQIVLDGGSVSAPPYKVVLSPVRAQQVDPPDGPRAAGVSRQ